MGKPIAGAMARAQAVKKARRRQQCRPLLPVNPQGLDAVAEQLLQSPENGLSTNKSPIGMQRDSDILLNASRYIRRWLRGQPAVKEESLTDWLLYDISSKSPRFRYAAFSRHTEARETGADWEWWILFPRRSFRFRVQAKKLTRDGDVYASLAYTNKNGLQIDMLLASSDRANALPFYAFYTGSPSQTMCGAQRHDEGAFLGGARRMFSDFIAPGKKQVQPAEVLRRTTPLSCLLGCPLVQEQGDDLLRFLGSYYAEDFQGRAPSGAPQQDGHLGVYDQTPQFVTSFVQASAEGLPEWWEDEFGESIRDVKALLVYDLRKGKRGHSSLRPASP